jgi:Protein of unknown function (DUF998)
MTTIPNTQGTVSRPRLQGCSASGNVTRSLLGYLALAGPLYAVVSLAQALTRPGFSLARDEWSLLALGHMGWIQMANLILTGAMTVAGGIGIRRAVGRSAPAGTWAPRPSPSPGSPPVPETRRSTSASPPLSSPATHG